MLIQNAKLYSMEGAPIPCGYLRFQEGKIVSLGPMEEQPRPEPDEEVLDAAGKTLTPGFVDAHTHLGMWGDSVGFEGADGNEITDPTTPQLRALDAINPMDKCFREAAAHGVTTAVTGPGSANPIGGQMAAIKTAPTRRVDDCILKAPLAIKFAFGENPKGCYNEKGHTPMTRMATASIIREQLASAKRYAEEQQKAKEDEDYDDPEFDAKCEALLPLLSGEIQAHMHCHQANDILTAIRIAGEFHLDYVLVHCTEGYRIADVLKAENAKAVVGPYLCDRSKPELRSLTPKSPALLREKGVTAAICTDHPVIPLQYLPLCAGLAVREGLPYEDALRAITIVPATLLHLEDRVGSLAPGKDADFLLFDGDPLSIYSTPCAVYINGQPVVLAEHEEI